MDSYLNRLKSDEYTPQDLRFLQTNWRDVIPLTDDESEAFGSHLDNLENAIPAMTEDERVLLAQDLHLLGDFCPVHQRRFRPRCLRTTLSRDVLKDRSLYTQ